MVAVKQTDESDRRGRPIGGDTAEGLRDASRVDTEQLHGHVDEVVRSNVEVTLIGLLQMGADQLCRAGRYERSTERTDTRAGRYERKLETTASVVSWKVPKLRTLSFETVSCTSAVGRARCAMSRCWWRPALVPMVTDRCAE